jgi:hypothetical protein
MRALIGIASSVLVVLTATVWLSSANHSAMETSPASKVPVQATISIWEIHNHAHLEFLPIQQIEDDSLVFSAMRR